MAKYCVKFRYGYINVFYKIVVCLLCLEEVTANIDIVHLLENI